MRTARESCPASPLNLNRRNTGAHDDRAIRAAHQRDLGPDDIIKVQKFPTPVGFCVQARQGKQIIDQMGQARRLDRNGAG